MSDRFSDEQWRNILEPANAARCASIRAFRAPFGFPAMNGVDPRDRISLDSSPERQHVAGIRAEHDVMQVDPALNLSGLTRTFEVARNEIAGLDDLNSFQVAPGPGDIVGIDGPVAGDVVRCLFVH